VLRKNILGFFLTLSCVLVPPAFYVATAAGEGAVLPIHALTPGAIDPAVTQANINRTICVVGYTKTVRPPVSYTNALKFKQLSGSYSRYGTTNMKLFEEDHLIPLAVGGSPTNPKNLWPEPWAGASGARMKDVLELKMHLMVCAHKITLTAAQKIFATDWYQGYVTYVAGK
jgi:hypothetical protein